MLMPLSLFPSFPVLCRLHFAPPPSFFLSFFTHFYRIPLVSVPLSFSTSVFGFPSGCFRLWISLQSHILDANVIQNKSACFFSSFYTIYHIFNLVSFVNTQTANRPKVGRTRKMKTAKLLSSVQSKRFLERGGIRNQSDCCFVL